MTRHSIARSFVAAVAALLVTTIAVGQACSVSLGTTVAAGPAA